jgi:hypothetical protein
MLDWLYAFIVKKKGVFEVVGIWGFVTLAGARRKRGNYLMRCTAPKAMSDQQSPKHYNVTGD